MALMRLCVYSITSILKAQIILCVKPMEFLLTKCFVESLIFGKNFAGTVCVQRPCPLFFGR